ncbi:MAG: zinc ribbon domain-containing protein [Chitinivibrionales bacterium]|nr:zinc ribbon domain-containing protein [Chitinivibrionales bacterium]
MPIYEYQCKSCHHIFEELVSKISNETRPCPSCSSPDTEKLMSAAGINTRGKEPACASTCPSVGASCCSGGSCHLNH